MLFCFKLDPKSDSFCSLINVSRTTRGSTGASKLLLIQVGVITLQPAAQNGDSIHMKKPSLLNLDSNALLEKPLIDRTRR